LTSWRCCHRPDRHGQVINLDADMLPGGPFQHGHRNAAQGDDLVAAIEPVRRQISAGDGRAIDLVGPLATEQNVSPQTIRQTVSTQAAMDKIIARLDQARPVWRDAAVIRPVQQGDGVIPSQTRRLIMACGSSQHIIAGGAVKFGASRLAVGRVEGAFFTAEPA
jgi:hypothetical protein